MRRHCNSTDIRVVTPECLSVYETEVQKFVNYVCSLTSDGIQSSKQVNCFGEESKLYSQQYQKHPLSQSSIHTTLINMAGFE